MAITIITSYAGGVVEKLLARAVTGNEVVGRGLAHIETGITQKRIIPRMKTGDMIQRYITQPTQKDAQGDFTLDERSLEPKKLMALTTFDPSAFEKYWKHLQPSGNLVFRELPPSAQNALLAAMSNSLSFELGSLMINSTEGAGKKECFTGLLPRMIADADTVKLDKALLSVSAGMIEKLNFCYKAIPTEIRAHKGLRFLMGRKDLDVYNEELMALPNKSIDPTAANIARFRGVDIEALTAWPEGIIVATITGMDYDSNLWIGVNATNDADTIKMDKVDNIGDLYFFKMVMSVDTNIMFGEDVVLLDTRVPAAAPQRVVRTPSAPKTAKDVILAPDASQVHNGDGDEN